MKNKQKRLNIVAGILALVFVGVVICGCIRDNNVLSIGVGDNIEQVDLDGINLEPSGVEVNFSEVILSHQNESRRLIVSTQSGKVTIQLTDRLIEKFDFEFMKKTQSVSYTGTGYFVVDLDNLTTENIIQDKDKKTVTVRIDHAYLQAIEIDPNKIIIDEVKEGLLARGDIKLTVADYNTIEKELRSRLEEKFNTASNGQAADEIALKMVKEIFEPIVRAIDRRYEVIVEFK